MALGALVFNFVFWGFGFLRMGTTGLTAQALGAADALEIRASLGRAVLIALIVGAALIALQWPIRELAFALISGSPKVEALARDYYDIRIWAAPATLLNYALLGWFVGLSQARVALLLQLVLNLTNMAAGHVVRARPRYGRKGRGAGNGHGRSPGGRCRARHRRDDICVDSAAAGTSSGLRHRGASGAPSL